MFSSIDKYLGLTLKGRYRLERFLGEGLRGQAYLAYDSLLEGWVVVKIIKDEIEGFPVPLGEEWIDEPKKAMQVRSQPHIAIILDLGDEEVKSSGETTRVPFIVWEYIDGTSFDDLLTSDDCPTISETINIARQFCSTLIFLRERKLSHGDLHPRNVMLMRYPGGEVAIKLIDFGMARNVLTARARHDDLTGAMGILVQLVDKLFDSGYLQDDSGSGNMLRDVVRSAGNLLPAGKMSLEEFSEGIDQVRKNFQNSTECLSGFENLSKRCSSNRGSGSLPEFFGRISEMRTILDSIKKSFTQRFTRRILVKGDPGAGKTSLINKLTDELSQIDSTLASLITSPTCASAS